MFAMTRLYVIKYPHVCYQYPPRVLRTTPLPWPAPPVQVRGGAAVRLALVAPARHGRHRSLKGKLESSSSFFRFLCCRGAGAQLNLKTREGETLPRVSGCTRLSPYPPSNRKQNLESVHRILDSSAETRRFQVGCQPALPRRAGACRRATGGPRRRGARFN